MILDEIYECAFKYYEFHKELMSEQRINNIQIIFGIIRASFFRNYNKCNQTFQSIYHYNLMIKNHNI